LDENVWENVLMGSKLSMLKYHEQIQYLSCNRIYQNRRTKMKIMLFFFVKDNRLNHHHKLYHFF
jgi:hypothetical protein